MAAFSCRPSALASSVPFCRATAPVAEAGGAPALHFPAKLGSYPFAFPDHHHGRGHAAADVAGEETLGPGNLPGAGAAGQVLICLDDLAHSGGSHRMAV